MAGRVMRLGLVLVSTAALALATAAPALGAFPGENGKIAFESAGGVIEVINPDGTGRLTLTTGEDPRWSPDGARIAFTRSDGLYVAAADGSGATQIVPGGVRMGAPTWSPDGSQLAFARHGACDIQGGCSQSHLFITDDDGTGLHEVVTGVLRPAEPAWSPDGTKFLATDDGGGNTSPRIFRINVDGSGLEYLTSPSQGINHQPSWAPSGARHLFARDTTNPDRGTIASNPFTIVHPQPVGGAWSPDGSRIALAHVVTTPCSPNCHSDLFTIDPTGANEVNLTNDMADQGNPDWQPIPVNGYPRPRSAHPVDVSLVPAYEPCAADNRWHGPPLVFRSCAPPVRTPGQLTVGTPDANGQAPRSTGQVKLNTIVGNPATPADEADVRLRATITDVRMASDLSDYTGALEARMTLRITDKDNTPHPGGPGAATVEDTTYSFPVPCAATGDATIGSLCAVDTMAEALVPGIAKERGRAVWELGQVEVLDGGGGVFMREGIFVP